LPPLSTDDPARVSPERIERRVPASSPFAARVYDLVARIPHGRVTTYGRIARAIGDPRGARMVGWALMHVVDDARDLPCHRVVNRVGLLSGGWHFGHPDVMRGLLRAEGVPFADDYQVDLARCLWEPWSDEEPPP
jgi:methylated-DNA-protein-cysteine methyltransferase-like protein